MFWWKKSIALVIEMNTFNYLMHCPCIVYHTQHFIKTEFLKVLNYALNTVCCDKHTTFETNNLIQSNRSVFLLMQNYSRTFFQTEISNVIFAAIFAICWRPLHFDNFICTKRKRDKFYQKYLRVKFLFKGITIIHLTTENLKMYEKRLS